MPIDSPIDADNLADNLIDCEVTRCIRPCDVDKPVGILVHEDTLWHDLLCR